MPKLKEDSLSKKFTCEYCGQAFRTRQGLSGHIQFKHPKGKEDPLKDILLKTQLAVDAAKELSIENPAPAIFKQFIVAKATLKTLDVECTVKDLKNYMLFSLAIRAENERLRKQLANDFINIILSNK